MDENDIFFIKSYLLDPKVFNSVNISLRLHSLIESAIQLVDSDEILYPLMFKNA